MLICKAPCSRQRVSWNCTKYLGHQRQDVESPPNLRAQQNVRREQPGSHPQCSVEVHLPLTQAPPTPIGLRTNQRGFAAQPKQRPNQKAVLDARRQTEEEKGNPGHSHPQPEPQPTGPGGHHGDLCSQARTSPTLTGEELLDAREATARPTQEDADYDPGESHSHNQGHDAEGAWRQDRQGKATSDASELPMIPGPLATRSPHPLGLKGLEDRKVETCGRPPARGGQLQGSQLGFPQAGVGTFQNSLLKWALALPQGAPLRLLMFVVHPSHPLFLLL